MKKSDGVKVVKAEILPSPESILRPGIDRAVFDRVVQQKVAEILAERDAAVLEPFFRSRQIVYELRRLQSVPEQESWRVFYERHGCLYCHTQERGHGGCGMCFRCYPRSLNERKAIIRELMDHPERMASGHRKPEQEMVRPAGEPTWRNK
jgi:hypothetical protein